MPGEVTTIPVTSAWRVLFAPFLLAIVAAVLRLNALGDDSLWQDEALCVANARLAPAALFALLRDTGNQPPGYHLVLGGWMSLVEKDEAAVRSLSAFLGIVTVLVFGLWCRRLFGDRALVPALALAAVSSCWIEWSRDGCMYALFLALALVQQFLVTQTVAAKYAPGPVLWIVLGLLRAALWYIHYFAAMFAVAEAVVVAAAAWWRRAPRLVIGWLCSALVTGACVAPWVPTFLDQQRRVADSWWSQPLSLGRLVNVPRQWTLWLPEIEHAPWNTSLIPMALVGASILIVFSLVGMVGGRRSMQRGDVFLARPSDRWIREDAIALPFDAAVAIPFIFCLTQVAITIMLSLERSLFEAKYLLAATPGFFALFVAGWVAADRLNIKLIASMALGFVLFANLGADYLERTQPGYRPAPMRDVAATILAEFQQGDAVVVRSAADLATLNYYLNAGDTEIPPQLRAIAGHGALAVPLYFFGERPPFFEGLGAMPDAYFVQDANLLVAGHRRVWFTLDNLDARPWDDLPGSREQLHEWLQHYARELAGVAPPKEAHTSWGRVNLYLFAVERSFDFDEAFRQYRIWRKRP